VNSVVSAAIAASVSLLVAFLGHWQWRRQQASAAADRYQAQRAEALGELWDKLNDHSTAARLAQLDAAQFYRNVQDLNFFLIRRSPFLTESEKELARLYLESIYAFRVRVEESKDKAAHEALLTSVPLHRVGELMGALASGDVVQDLENRLASHIKDALRGKAGEIDVVRLRLELLAAEAVDQTRSPRSRTHEQEPGNDLA
jgi:hypothetical protein